MSGPSELVQQPRPRTRSMLSFSSNKSSKSQKSAASQIKGKLLEETSLEKHRNRIQSKADPTLAMSEAEPSLVATGQVSNLESIRAIQHRDLHGNLIVDPDRSNPTRSRWERPLDTIRSFEAAVDGGYSRKPYRRIDSADALNGYSRRSSYHQGNMNQMNNMSARAPQDNGYYGNRGAPSRPDSFIDSYASHHSYNRPRYAPRMAPEPMHNGPPQHGHGHGVYPVQGYQRSYDTVTSASGTGSNATDQWGNSTDPSSENSSIERMPPPPKPDLAEAYGFSGFGGVTPELQTQNYSSHSSTLAQDGQHGQMGVEEPPKPPPHATKPPAVRTPIKLGSSSTPVTAPAMAGEKRKSWFKRFSKA